MTIEWTDNNVDWLKRLWAEGWTCSQIGKLMGCTANTVIGKVHRLHLPNRPHVVFGRSKSTEATMAASVSNTKPTRHRSNATKAGDMAAKAAVSPVNGYIRSLAPDKPLPAFARPEAPEAIVGISFLEMADAKGAACKWPMNDGSPWLFCGQHSMEHKPYCEFHYRRAYHAIGGTR